MAIPVDPVQLVLQISHDLRNITDKGVLGCYLASVTRQYRMYDLQLISGKIERDLRIVPFTYRKKVMPFMRDWIFGRYHTVLLMERNGKFSSRSAPITDIDLYRSFCEMLPSGCMVPGDEHDPYPPGHAPWYRLFMFLMAGFAMYVLDEPGHPVGMPFPGGGLVRRSGDRYYCPIRDKEEEIFYSICNFCPAIQEPER